MHWTPINNIVQWIVKSILKNKKKRKNFMNNNDEELNEILNQPKENLKAKRFPTPSTAMESSTKDSHALSNLVQWTTGDNKRFLPASTTINKLIPGVYEIKHCPNSGIYFEKLKVKTEGLLNFPQTNSEKVVQEIQNFWNREKMFRDYNLTHKRGIILWGPPGCHAAGTKVIMYDGSKKNVEDVKIGDFLMGPDSKPRKVLDLCRGKDEMYEVTPTKGDSFVVNGHHILSLHKSHSEDKSYPEILNISVNDYCKLSECEKTKYKLRRSLKLIIILIMTNFLLQQELRF